MKTTRQGEVRIRHSIRPDAEKTPPIRPRHQICPLLAGLNRMGCRGPHCQWWIPYEEAETGDCAMVFLALRDCPTPSDELVSALREKLRSTDEWNRHLGEVTTVLPSKGEARPVAERADESGTEDPEERPRENGSVAESSIPRRSVLQPQVEDPSEEPPLESGSAAKLTRTSKGMSRQQVEDLWGQPQETRDDAAGICYVYRLPEGGRLYLIFKGGILARVAKW